MKQVIKKYQSILIGLLLIVVCGFAMLPLFHAGLFPMHDDEQISRLYELHKVLGDGQIPPRWVPDLGFGYGFPLYNFYPPLFYYVAELFHLFSFSFITATKLALGLSFLLSAGFMYAWVKDRFGRLAGMFAALVYVYAPYHAVDIYVRGAFAEFFSFVWIPAVLWSFDKLSRKQSFGNIVLCGIFLACVVLSHNLVAMQVIPFFVIYACVLLFQQRKACTSLMKGFIFSGIISLGISAYFWIPALLEKKFTLVDTILTKELANYAIHFVCPNQLWSSPWGYGGSIAGCLDGLSFEIGKVHIGLIAFGIILFVMFGKNLSQRLIGITGIGLFGLSIFLTTQYSAFIWNAIVPLAYLQFPWRFLIIAAVFSSFIGGYCIFAIRKLLDVKIASVVVIICSIIVLFAVRNDFKPQRYMLVGDDHYITDINWLVSSMSYEYVPKEVATEKSAIGTTLLAITQKDIPQKSYRVVSGQMKVFENKNKSQEKEYTILVQERGIFQINTYSFPGWLVIVNGAKVRYNDTNRLHLIQLALNPGKYHVRAIFQDTLPRKVGNGITLGSIVLLVLSSAYMIKRKII